MNDRLRMTEEVYLSYYVTLYIPETSVWPDLNLDHGIEWSFDTLVLLSIMGEVFQTQFYFTTDGFRSSWNRTTSLLRGVLVKGKVQESSYFRLTGTVDLQKS